MPRPTAAANAASLPRTARHPRRVSRQKTHTATAAEAASINFQPWTEGKPINLEAIRQDLQLLGMLVPFCSTVMFKTKEELMADIETWPEEKGDIIVRAFIDACAFLKVALELLESAEARILVAGSSLENVGDANV